MKNLLKLKGNRPYFNLLAAIPIPMRITLILLFGVIFQASAHSLYSQVTTLTLNMKNATVEEVLNVIEQNSELYFLYNSKLIDVDRRVDISAKKQSLESILKMLFRATDVDFKIEGKQVILSQKGLLGLPDSSLHNKRRITGSIRDEGGEPIIGVSILEKGTTNGVITDMSGNFSIQVEENAILRISYIGYHTQEVKTGDRNNIQVVLSEDNKLLDEVIVVGYGTQKRGNLTGAIASIKASEIVTTTHSSLAQSLQGKIPGLQIRQQSGEPGEYNTMINIRGFGSPLYVIDGIARDGASEFQRLDPNDIESISILKDASAAIYGLNAGNGVVLVTTKKGQKSAPRFTYNGTFGFQKPTDVPKMANASQFLEMYNDSRVNIGLNPTITKEELSKWQQGLPGYESINWYDEVMKNSAGQTQQNLSVRGGNEAVDYFVSFGYFGENGLIKSNDMNYDRFNVRSNLTAKLNKNLTADIMLSGRYDKRLRPRDFFVIFKHAQISLPTERPYVHDNPNYLSKTSLENPVALMQEDVVGYEEYKNKVFQSSASLTYKAPFLKGLEVKGTVAYDSETKMQKNLYKAYDLYTYNEENERYVSEQQASPSRINNSNSDNNRLVMQAQVSYNNTFADKHTVGATFVYEQMQSFYRYSWLQRRYDFYTNDQINQASTDNQETDGHESETASLSYIGKVNYSYRNKYLIDFAFRYDGSYRYAPGNRWDFFPVISGAWRISEEKFIKNNFTFLDNLKIRASYGKVGENAGAPFQYVFGYTTAGKGGYEMSDGSYTTGIASPAITNKELSWYTSTILNLGLDIGLFNNRLNVEFDVYQRDREGLLATRNLSLPNTFGAKLPEENLNSDRVQGIELMVSHQNKIRDFIYGVSVNLNFARTMRRYVERAEYRSSWDKWRNGNTDRWSDVLWGYDLIGQFQTMEELLHSPLHEGGHYGNTRQLPGSFIFRDVNGDGMIDGKDQLPLFWGGQPKLHYGIILNAAWKGFDFNALLQGSGKYSIRFNEAYAQVLWFEANTPAYFYDRWHLSDPYDPDSEWIPGKWPAVKTSEHQAGMNRESSAYRKDASYLRLKSLELGYTIPSKYLKKYWIENMRIYINGHNLFTFADSFVKPFDPEKIEGSFSAGMNYPLTKSYNIGINVTF